MEFGCFLGWLLSYSLRLLSSSLRLHRSGITGEGETRLQGCIEGGVWAPNVVGDLASGLLRMGLSPFVSWHDKSCTEVAIITVRSKHDQHLPSQLLVLPVFFLQLSVQTELKQQTNCRAERALCMYLRIYYYLLVLTTSRSYSSRKTLVGPTTGSTNQPTSGTQ